MASVVPLSPGAVPQPSNTQEAWATQNNKVRVGGNAPRQTPKPQPLVFSVPMNFSQLERDAEGQGAVKLVRRPADVTANLDVQHVSDRALVWKGCSMDLTRAAGLGLPCLPMSDLPTVDQVKRHGAHGNDGINGAHGKHGTHGTGQNGERGVDGTIGQRGVDALHAGNATLTVVGALESIQVNGTVASKSTNDNITLQNGLLFIDAHGGDGGRGGNGGHGGNGGDGGRGVTGRAGSAGGPGQSGGMGGPGGRGGDGGDGGHGARGMDGGHAGNGGHVTLSVTPDQLQSLALVEVDALGGKCGRKGWGGKGGRGGAAGPGGFGGPGGPGGPGVYNSQGQMVMAPGMSGMSGPAGPPGNRGRDGNDAPDGIDGNISKDGSITWQIINPGGGVLQSATDRFHAAMTEYRIVDENQDGVCEPNSIIMAYGFDIINNGGLPTPPTCLLCVPPTPTAELVQEISCHSELLPVLQPNQAYRSSSHYCFRLPDQPPIVTNTVYKSISNIQTMVTCLNRPLKESLLSSSDIIVQWPIQTHSIHAPRILGPEEEKSCTLQISNISSRAYGHLADGAVEIQLKCDKLLHFKRGEMTPQEKADEAAGYHPFDFKVNADGNGAVVTIRRIEANSTVSIRFHVGLDSDAGDALYEILDFNANVFYKGRMIESWVNPIRITPSFNATDVDVLLVTCSATTVDDLKKWREVIQALKLTMHFWDVERYQGLSCNSETQWLGLAKYVVFATNTASYAPSSLLYITDCIRHFENDPNNGVLFLNGPPQDTNHALFDYSRPLAKTKRFHEGLATTNYQLFPSTDPQPLYKLNCKIVEEKDPEKKEQTALTSVLPVLTEDQKKKVKKWRGFHPCACVCKVTEADVWKYLEKKRVSAQKDDGFRAVNAAADVKLTGKYGCYNYGEMALHRSILPKTSNFVMVDFADGAKQPKTLKPGIVSKFEQDGIKSAPPEVSLNDTQREIASLTIASLYLLTVPQLLNLLNNEPYDELRNILDPYIKLIYPYSNCQGYKDVVQVLIYEKLRHETLTKSKALPHMTTIVQNVIEQVDQKKLHEESLAILGELLMRIHKERLSFPWCFGRGASQRSTISELFESVVGHSKDPIDFRQKVLKRLGYGVESFISLPDLVSVKFPSVDGVSVNQAPFAHNSFQVDSWRNQQACSYTQTTKVVNLNPNASKLSVANIGDGSAAAANVDLIKEEGEPNKAAGETNSTGETTDAKLPYSAADPHDVLNFLEQNSAASMSVLASQAGAEGEGPTIVNDPQPNLLSTANANTAVLVPALKSLTDLVRGHPDRAEQLLASNAMPVLFDLLLQYIHFSPLVCENVIHALASFLCTESTRLAIASVPNSINLLMQMLQKDGGSHGAVFVSLCFVIRTLADVRLPMDEPTRFVAKEMHEYHVTRHVMFGLEVNENHHPAAVEAAVSCLAALSRADSIHNTEIYAHRGITRVRRYLSATTTPFMGNDSIQIASANIIKDWLNNPNAGSAWEKGVLDCYSLLVSGQNHYVSQRVGYAVIAAFQTLHKRDRRDIGNCGLANSILEMAHEYMRRYATDEAFTHHLSTFMVSMTEVDNPVVVQPGSETLRLIEQARHNYPESTQIKSDQEQIRDILDKRDYYHKASRD